MATPRYPWRRGNNNMKSSLKCLMIMTKFFEGIQLRRFTNKIYFFINYSRLIGNSKLDTFSLFVLYPEVQPHTTHLFTKSIFKLYTVLKLNRMTIKCFL